jgi:dTDP-4-amino-4,6-dideoxygalactose transaminase
MRVHGCTETYYHKRIGGNFRMDPMQAALLDIKLQHILSYTTERQKHAHIYLQQLDHLHGKELLLPKPIRGTHVYNQFTLYCERRDELKKYLLDKEISCAVYYPLGLHKQECYNSLSQVVLPVTDKLCDHVLSIPIATELTNEQITFVADTIKMFYRND